MTDLTPYKYTSGRYRAATLNALIDAIEAAIDAGGGSVSGLATAANRSALAAQSSGTLFLTESGREGTFTFDDSDLSAKVTGDPAQAVYVAPSSDTTGASGAWVRQYDGTLIFDWFGAVPGDYATGVSADCSEAWEAFKTFAAANPRNRSAGYQCAAPVLKFPGNQYYFSDTVHIDVQVHLKGFASGQYNEATWLRFPSDTGGILVKDQDFTGGGTIIEGFMVQGGGGTTSGVLADDLLKSGIRLLCRTTVRECYVRNFAGAGICIVAAVGGIGEDFTGNANNWRIDDTTVEFNKTHGVYVSGGDANAGTGIAVNAQYNTGFGICDDSFLGNAWVGCHSAGNGGGWAYDDGRLYYAKHGRHLDTQLHYSLADYQGTAPADSPFWEDAGEFGGPAPTVPQWSGSVEVHTGGAYGGVAGYSTWFGCYYETGQAPPQPNGLVIGGFMGDGIVRTSIYGVAGGLAIPDRLSVTQKHIGETASRVALGGISGYGHSDLLTWNAPEATEAFDIDRCYSLTFERATGQLVYAGDWSNGLAAISNPTGSSVFRIHNGLGSLKYGRSTAVDAANSVQINQLALGSGDNARIQTSGTAAPASGSHGRGEIVWNTEPSASGKVGWICTVAGTPGTWKPFGAIDA